MGVRSLLTFFLLFYLNLPILFADSTPPSELASSDVKKIMEQLFELHIEEKEMNPQLAARAIKIFINNFDSTHSYLLDDEVSPYLKPNAQLINSVMADYNQDRFTIFFTLNAMMRNSIMRVRQFRDAWKQFPEKLVSEAKELKSNDKKKEKYPKTQQELQDWHRKQFLKLIAAQMKHLGRKTYEGVEGKLVRLCDKQLCQMENQYLGINEKGELITDQQQEHQVVMRILKAMAQSLDAHTAFYSPEEAYALKVHLEKGMCGIGVVLHEGIDGVTISEILEGGPAEKSENLRVGDTIVEVDGENVQNFSFQHVLEIMRGEEGTKTILGIVRPAEGEKSEFLHVELIRSKIAIGGKRVDAQSEPFGEGIIGKITLHSFYEGEQGVSSEIDIRKAIEDLRKQGPLLGIILDMRENNGGFLSQAIRVSSLFVSSGIIVISKYSDGSIKYYRALNGTRFYDGPLVVLISRGSASAAEIVAQALQDYGVAIIAGDEKTYGKGTIQHQTVTRDHSDAFFKVTIGRYYTVSGRSTQIEGVKSDVMIPTELCYEEIGENFLEYPLPADHMGPMYEDNLADIDPQARKWFHRFYSPSVQGKDTTWQDRVSKLQANSKQRLIDNLNYQKFIKHLQGDHTESNFGANDLQMEESVNILKDMILLQKNK